jgi:hypothetical protein
MGSKRIDHFLGGILGKYVGHSEVHDDGEIEHFEYDGSIIPGEKYVGRSKAEKASGGGGGGGGDNPGSGFLLIILSPLLLVIAMVALSAVVFIGPFYWVFREYFGKKTAVDANERPRFVGAGWVILAFFIILIGIPYAIILIRGFIYAHTLIFRPGQKPPELIVFWLPIIWLICLLLFAVNIVRKNPVGRVVSVFVFFGGLWALGSFLAFKNNQGPNLMADLKSAMNNNVFVARQKNQTPAAATTKGYQDLSNENRDMPQISSISTVLPQQLQTITIQGHGFGTRSPYTGDSDFIRVTNETKDWNAGSSKDYPQDKITLSITSWTDTKILIDGFTGVYGAGQWSLGEGDNIRFRVWNPQTGQGPAIYMNIVAGTATKTPVGTSTNPDANKLRIGVVVLPPAAPARSGIRHYEGPPIPHGGIVVFENMPKARLKFNFNHAAWQLLIKPNSDGTKKVILISLAQGYQSSCDLGWEIVE